MAMVSTLTKNMADLQDTVTTQSAFPSINTNHIKGTTTFHPPLHPALLKQNLQKAITEGDREDIETSLNDSREIQDSRIRIS